MKLKIGIIAGKFEELSNWQVRVIQSILDDPDLELNAVIPIGICESTPPQRFFKRFSSIGLGSTLLSIQARVERNVFFKEKTGVHNQDLKPIFEKLVTVELPQRYLDIIINLEDHNVVINEIPSPKYGIWYLLHGDFEFSLKKRPVGFSEVLEREPTIGFTLLKHNGADQVQIVDRSFFNRGWSMVETASIAKEGGVSVLLKNLKRLRNGYDFDLNSHPIPQYTAPVTARVLKYIRRFYGQLIKKMVQKIAYQIWGRRHECWSIFVGSGNFFKSSFEKMKPLKMPNDEFWADPFLFRYEDQNYIFFENYSYNTKRGKISCGIVHEEKLSNIVDVLDVDYHLSFPFIFQEDGEVYLMPETSENKRLEIYKAIEFPTKWELFSTAFEGEMVADAFFYDDENNDKWLFINKQAAETAPMNSELFIYKVDSLYLNDLQPHLQNPVIIDARVARNGGSIFSYRNERYRPSQRNVDGIYGRALNINKIKKLTIEEYEEENVRVFEPDFDENLIATHHLHQMDDLFVFDAAYESK